MSTSKLGRNVGRRGLGTRFRRTESRLAGVEPLTSVERSRGRRQRGNWGRSAAGLAAEGFGGGVFGERVVFSRAYGAGFSRRRGRQHESSASRANRWPDAPRPSERFAGRGLPL